MNEANLAQNIAIESPIKTSIGASAQAAIEQGDDIYEQRLQEKTSLLQQCQHDKSLKSCSLCESLIGCEVRDAYVKAVYESMSKGQQGNFDFN